MSLPFLLSSVPPRVIATSREAAMVPPLAGIRFPLEVVREVRRVISLRARRPFMLGYRVSPEAPGDRALRVGDTLVLVDTLFEAGNLDYLRASLYSALAGMPLDADDGRTTTELFIECVAGRH
ncbi:hypothetical protein [Stenotrophomonas maltophilia]|uniref:hypothetical protein n=1 Tax=Stenotrophomonas maltophilia TaxID=40324 RepID=UPI0018C8A978|nr:hypothetical protein [Stenotrophomonas maltophilia]